MNGSVLWVCAARGCKERLLLGTEVFDSGRPEFKAPCAGTHSACRPDEGLNACLRKGIEAAREGYWGADSPYRAPAWYGFRFWTSGGLIPGSCSFKVFWDSPLGRLEANLAELKTADQMIAAFEALRESVEEELVEIDPHGGDGFIDPRVVFGGGQ